MLNNITNWTARITVDDSIPVLSIRQIRYIIWWLSREFQLLDSKQSSAIPNIIIWAESDNTTLLKQNKKKTSWSAQQCSDVGSRAKLSEQLTDREKKEDNHNFSTSPELTTFSNLQADMWIVTYSFSTSVRWYVKWATEEAEKEVDERFPTSKQLVKNKLKTHLQ